jgi:PBP1b-binding outer membrane lipoprotein LpoB
VRELLVFVGVVVVAGCVHGHATTVATTQKIKLLTLPTESDAFPAIATAATTALTHAKISGVDEAAMSKVSIEVVQLSIECVDPTASCYDSAAKSLAANKLLFAQIDVDGAKPKITVTLFDRANRAPKIAERTYANEAAAVAGLDGLVAEATR